MSFITNSLLCKSRFEVFVALCVGNCLSPGGQLMWPQLFDNKDMRKKKIIKAIKGGIIKM
jgi:hypothetical protein